MRTRPVAFAVVVLVAVALGVGAFVMASSSNSSSSTTTTWERDIPAPTFDGPLATFEEGQTRNAEGNVTSGELPQFIHRSARLEDVVVPVVVRPVGLNIPDIQVESAPVLPVGVRGDDLQLDVPPDANSVVWYEHGSSPGAPGSAVLAGHVDYGGVAGVFYDLRWLELGERFDVAYEDGTTRAFEVVASEQFDKARLPTSELFTDDGDPTLVLITCGGEFDEGQRSYSDNLVVYAVPASGSPPA